MFQDCHYTPPSRSLVFISVCPTDICHHYCVNSKACTLSSSGYVECVCPARFEGNKCEVDKCLRCHGAPCLINDETGDVVCKWVLGLSSSSFCYKCGTVPSVYGDASVLCRIPICRVQLLHPQGELIDLIKSEKKKKTCRWPNSLQQLRLRCHRWIRSEVNSPASYE